LPPEITAEGYTVLPRVQTVPFPLRLEVESLEVPLIDLRVWLSYLDFSEQGISC
jgi:hypothetical protein